MQIRRRSAIVIASSVFLLPLGLAGCGGGGSSDATDDGDGSVTDPLHPLTAYNADWGSVGVFTAAFACAECHRPSTDTDPGIPAVLRYPLEDSGADVSPPTQWRHTMMAQSLHDPYFLANLDEETHVFPDLAGTIEDICLTCHSPMARTHAYQTGAGLDPAGHYRLETALVEDIAREGGSCSSCHQISDDGGLGETTFSGEYTISATDRVIYGQYQNPITGPMTNLVGYLPAYGEHMTRSGHCATCHVLYTPTLDAETGLPTGGQFLEQGVYLEWENSVFVTGTAEAQECQDCHMPDPDPDLYATRLALRPDGSVNVVWPERGPTPPFHQHNMVGANTHVLGMLRDYRDVLGIESSTSIAGFDSQISQTRTFLRAAGELRLDNANLENDTLAVDLGVVNLTGHKLPTSFPSRRVWVNLTVTDANGETVFDSGTPDASGRISTDAAALQEDCLLETKPVDFDGDHCVEPHRDLITNDRQVAIYEPVLADTNGNITYVLLKAASYLKDNRVPPEGFVTANQHPDTAPVAIGDDADFNADASGIDKVHYRIPVAGHPAPFRVDARLLYQSIRPAFAAALHSESEHVQRFQTMLADSPPSVEQLAAAGADVQ